MTSKAFCTGFRQGWFLPFLALKAFSAVFRRTWHGEYEEAVLEVNALWQTQPEAARKRIEMMKLFETEIEKNNPLYRMDDSAEEVWP